MPVHAWTAFTASVSALLVPVALLASAAPQSAASPLLDSCRVGQDTYIAIYADDEQGEGWRIEHVLSPLSSAAVGDTLPAHLKFYESYNAPCVAGPPPVIGTRGIVDFFGADETCDGQEGYRLLVVETSDDLWIDNPDEAPDERNSFSASAAELEDVYDTDCNFSEHAPLFYDDTPCAQTGCSHVQGSPTNTEGNFLLGALALMLFRRRERCLHRTLTSN